MWFAKVFGLVSNFLLLQGLEKLEYRGYDSAGLAVVDAEKGEIDVKKARGRLRALEEMTSGKGG